MSITKEICARHGWEVWDTDDIGPPPAAGSWAWMDRAEVAVTTYSELGSARHHENHPWWSLPVVGFKSKEEYEEAACFGDWHIRATTTEEAAAIAAMIRIEREAMRSNRNE